MPYPVAAVRNKGVTVISFVPTQVTGLKLWLDASDATTLYTDNGLTTLVSADGNAVGGWKDKSGNNNHVLQATADNKPAYKVNILNGKSVVRFNAVAAKQRLVSAAVAALTQPNTVFLVCNFPDGVGSYIAIDGQSTNREAIYYLGGVTLKPTAYAGTNLSHGSAYTTSYKYYTVVFNGNSSSIAINGGTATTGAAGANSLTGWTVGCNAAQNGSWMGNDICEILFYAGALSPTNTAAVQSYLAAKWGLVP